MSAIFPRTAERYWLLRTADDELRFTHQAAAESWAARLARQGVATQLSHHDEHTADDPQEERQVA